MADDLKGISTGQVLLISVIVVLVLALVAWALGLFESGGGETTYVVGAEDRSGGQLIVPNPSESGVAVDLPETPMTPVPQSESPAPAPTDAPTAAPAPAQATE
jgi:hypothetical protein